MRSPIHGGEGDVSEFERIPLWWPPVKVAAHHLGVYLEERHTPHNDGEGAAGDTDTIEVSVPAAPESAT